MPRPNRLTAALAVLLLGLTGCTSILPDAGNLAPRLALDPGAPGDGSGSPAIDTRLVIADPEAEAVYNTFNVAVATAPLQFEYLENAEWTDRVPVLWRIFLERRFENAAVVTVVGDRGDLPIGDYELKTDLRAFHIDRSRGGETARVTIGARLVTARGVTLGTRVFDADVTPTGSARLDTVAALNTAARRVSDEAIVWVRDLIATAEADRERATPARP